MRVLLITGSFPPMRCGVGDYTYRLALSLAHDAKLKVAVLTSKGALPLGHDDGIAIFPIVAAWDCKEIGVILDVTRHWAPDVIHIQYPTLGYGHKRLPWLLPLFLRMAGFPIVQTWHEVYPLKFLIKFGLLPRFLIRALVPGGLVVVRPDFRQCTDVLLRWALFNKTVRFIPNASSLPTVCLSSAERTGLRKRYGRAGTHMVAYFGFIYPRKRVELLFQIVNSHDSHLVIIGDMLREEELCHYPKAARVEFMNYYRFVRRLAEGEHWRNSVTMSGFLPNEEAARVIAAADAVIVPVLDGGGGWNTSIHAAQAQGTFVLTTSRQRHGYDPLENVYFAREYDLEDMKRALGQYIGKRTDSRNRATYAWRSICESHAELYKTQVPRKNAILGKRSDGSG